MFLPVCPFSQGLGRVFSCKDGNNQSCRSWASKPFLIFLWLMSHKGMYSPPHTAYGVHASLHSFVLIYSQFIFKHSWKSCIEPRKMGKKRIDSTTTKKEKETMHIIHHNCTGSSKNCSKSDCGNRGLELSWSRGGNRECCTSLLVNVIVTDPVHLILEIFSCG